MVSSRLRKRIVGLRVGVFFFFRGFYDVRREVGSVGRELLEVFLVRDFGVV